MALLNYKFYIQTALVACFFAISCLTAEETEVTISVMSSGFLTPAVNRLATGALCIITFVLMAWSLPTARPTYDVLLKRTATPLILGVVAATLFNTLFVLEFWGFFAVGYLVEYMTSGFINGKLPAAWKDFTYGIICLPAFLIAFLAQFFEVNDAIYERISYSETSDDPSPQDDNETDVTGVDEDETDDNDNETDDSADLEDEDTSKGQDEDDDEDAKDGDDEDKDEDAKDDEDEDGDGDEDEDEVTKEDDEDVSENGDNDDEAEPNSSTTTSLTVFDGASGTEASVSIKSDASALPSKNPASSHSAASTPTVSICSAVAAVVVSIVAFFL